MQELQSTNDPATVPAVQAINLGRQFGDFVAVDNLNLTLRRGSFFGFLGPNGAGKSTTIKMLTGLLAPTSGTIRVLGRDIAQEPLEVKRRIGVVPEDLNLFERLTGAEMLTFTGRMYGLGKKEIGERSPELLDLMELRDEPKKLIVEYSHGNEKETVPGVRLDSSSGNSFLDEPFEGVDAIASRTLKDLLSRLTARGLTVFLTSHVLEIVERLCSDIAIIRRASSWRRVHLMNCEREFMLMGKARSKGRFRLRSTSSILSEEIAAVARKKCCNGLGKVVQRLCRPPWGKASPWLSSVVWN
jgi:ABC-2 type transport system ATP-binding protein